MIKYHTTVFSGGGDLLVCLIIEPIARGKTSSVFLFSFRSSPRVALSVPPSPLLASPYFAFFFDSPSALNIMILNQYALSPAPSKRIASTTSFGPEGISANVPFQ